MRDHLHAVEHVDPRMCGIVNRNRVCLRLKEIDIRISLDKSACVFGLWLANMDQCEWMHCMGPCQLIELLHLAMGVDHCNSFIGGGWDGYQKFGGAPYY